MTLLEMFGLLGLVCAAALGFLWGLGYGLLWAMGSAIVAGLIGWVFGVLIAHAVV